MSTCTLLDIALGRNVPLSTGIFKAVQTETPALLAFDVRTTEDTKFQTLAMTSLPTAGGFVKMNEGFSSGNVGLMMREFDAKLAGGKVQYDVIQANRWDAAHKNSGTTWDEIQTMGRMVAEMKHLEKCLFYGTAFDEDAFPGLKELTPYGTPLGLSDDPGANDFVTTVINAGGTTSSTASSAYSICFGEMDAQLVVCNDSGGELFTQTEPVKQHVAPDSTQPTKTKEHILFDIYGWFGLSVCGMNQTPNGVVPTQYAVRRLANLTNDSGKGLNDYKLEALCRSHGNNKTPNLIIANGRSGIQWGESKRATAVTAFLGGPGNAANNTVHLSIPRPDNYNGIPVIYTNAITSTEAINS